jgi:hypothetical protein
MIYDGYVPWCILNEKYVKDGFVPDDPWLRNIIVSLYDSKFNKFKDNIVHRWPLNAKVDIWN